MMIGGERESSIHMFYFHSYFVFSLHMIKEVCVKKCKSHGEHPMIIIYNKLYSCSQGLPLFLMPV